LPELHNGDNPWRRLTRKLLSKFIDTYFGKA
jgi:hypothetical protein